MDSWKNYFVSVGRQNIKNNIDHRVKEKCAIMSIQVTYESDHIFLLRNSTMSNALNFCFLMYFIVI